MSIPFSGQMLKPITEICIGEGGGGECNGGCNCFCNDEDYQPTPTPDMPLVCMTPKAAGGGPRIPSWPRPICTAT